MAEKEVIARSDVAVVDAADLLDEKKLSREELVKREARVGRRCAGPLKEGVRNKVDEKMRAAAEAKTEEDRQRLLNEASDLNRAGRTHCGYDMNKIFLRDDAPLDGKEHDYTCPKCGVYGYYRAAGPVAE